ncbi:isocitrate lyase/PEP mutase family protein [Sciscionella sediminilitoris]|uniref:isocitrate lyase/PEP mutase family protein n=1 Tax=Sciscionella sediminilitoris TaxID=1445613 RepID=UPI0004DEF2BD|nr:isocitrate lyase/phosphoenolpyruvate mutase family protein [Sciscionella sp. SE31]
MNELRSLHVPGKPLVLPNVWDADTAQLVVEAGFPVVATSSGALAAALGYGDHQQAPAAEVFAAAARIARAVPVPVTVDAESGYGLAPEELVPALFEAGAQGCNIEDTEHESGLLIPAADQAERIARMRAASTELVINARVDVFLHEDPSLTGAIARAEAYLEAGADCVYPIFLPGEHIQEFLDALSPAPVNLLCLPPKTPALADLTRSGAARVSLGTGLWRAQQQWLREQLAAMRA